MTIRLPRHLRLAVLAALILLSLASPASPVGAVPLVFVVDSTNDGSDANPGNGVCATGPGNCTLRAAIQEANANPGADTIRHGIASTPGVPVVIAPNSQLPSITEQVTLDLDDTASTGPLFLSGVNAGPNAHGVVVEAANTIIRDFTIGNFDGRGIWVRSPGGATIYGMQLGTDTTGSVAAPNNVGIFIDDAPSSIIGNLPDASLRNVISGNAVVGVRIIGPGTGNTEISGNYIGLNAAGTGALGNGTEGVLIRDAADVDLFSNVISGNTADGVLIERGSSHLLSGNLIGLNPAGTAAVPNGGNGVHVSEGTDHEIGGSAQVRNVISGNGGHGVHVENAPASNLDIQNNRVGTNSADTAGVGNAGSGIRIDGSDGVLIGGGLGSDFNVIRFNGTNGITFAASNNVASENIITDNTADGIRVLSGAGNEFIENQIDNNGELGIDLGPNGVTPPDGLGDADTGANNLVNQPVLASATLGASTTTVVGTLETAPSAFYTVDFFQSPACDPSGSGEGATFLGFTSGTASPTGLLDLNYVHPAALTAGTAVTAITTHSSLSDTSEFSNCVIVAATNDLDGDGILDAADNCPSNANPLQEHSDRNFIDQTPPSTQDDRTWPRSDATGDACDTDDDNDGILDVNEAAGCNASGPLSPTNRDTDGDRVLDGAECALGTNPASAASKPTAAACAAFLGVGASVDTDGDRLFDRVEYCAYNTDRLLLDTDGDQDASPLNANPTVNLIKDGCEAASLNNDRVVNSADQLLIALEITREVDQTLRLVSMDINKDGGVNSGDQLLMVGFITVLGSCP
jgi:CSLREA domain-containing protein